MIQRIYIHNYRCFENFELTLKGKSSALVIGKNGVGKSTLRKALEILHGIGLGENQLGKIFKRSDFSQHRTELPIRFEVSVVLDSKVFEYCIAIEWPDGFKEPRIKSEKLLVDGSAIFTRKEAQVDLAQNSTSFLVDWHSIGLPIIQMRGQNNPIEQFRSWLSQMILIAPVPAFMTGHSDEDAYHLGSDAVNFAAWFSGIYNRYPALYSVVETFLKNVFTDFQDFENRPMGDLAKNIFVRFKNDENGQPLTLDFKDLSDGEKSFFLCAVLLGANKYYGPLFCFWDEPDNFLSLSEVGHLVVALRKSFANSGQILVASHNPEAIRKFSDENTLILDRKSHLEPTTHRWLEDHPCTGDLVEALIRGDLSNGDE